MTKPAFEAHTLAVSELVVMLIEQSRHEPFTIQELFGEPRCWRRFSGLGGEIRILKPDAYIRLILGDFESTAFIELDLGSESLPTISRKCSTYIDYWNSGTEQRIHGVFPRVWWLVPDLQRQRAISATIRRLPEEARGLFAVGLTTESPALLTQLPKTQGGPQ